MLEALGIGDVAILAQQQPGRLHEQLRRYNQTHKLARRAPTAEEVASWIGQARQLPELVTYPAAAAGSEALAGMVIFFLGIVTVVALQDKLAASTRRRRSCQTRTS